jgi:hypothetical protein
MALFFLIQLEDNGLVGEDDGDTAWRSTTIRFGYGSAGIISDVLVDGYSGDRRATVTRDDFGLPSRLIEPLAIAIYRVCGRDMRETDCDFGQGLCNVEELIHRIFYRADASNLLDKFRAVIAAERQKKQQVSP